MSASTSTSTEQVVWVVTMEGLDAVDRGTWTTHVVVWVGENEAEARQMAKRAKNHDPLLAVLLTKVVNGTPEKKEAVGMTEEEI